MHNIGNVRFTPNSNQRTDITDVSNVPQADYALATSDVVVKAALDIGATWS
jgi:hypothetical protein